MLHDQKLQIIFERLIYLKPQDNNCQKIKLRFLNNQYKKELILKVIM